MRDAQFTPPAGANGTVQTTATLPSGQIVVAGSFTTFGGAARAGIVRLHADGSLDETFNPRFTLAATGGGVFALLPVGDGKLLVGGHFTEVGGGPRAGVVRLMSDGSLDPTFDAKLPSPSAVFTIVAAPDERLYVGGAFTSVGPAPGVMRPGFARFLRDGELDTSFVPTHFAGAINGDQVITQILPLPDGTLLIAGEFYTWDGTRNLHDLVRVDSSGKLDMAWQSPVGGTGTIAAVALDGEDGLLVAGVFPYSADPSDRAVVRVRLADGARDPAFVARFRTASGGVAVVNTMVRDANGRIVVGGDFATVNGAPQAYFARLLPDGSLDSRFTPPSWVNGEVATITADQAGRLLVGGDLTVVAGGAAPHLFRARVQEVVPRILGASATPATIGEHGNVSLTARVEPGSGATFQWYRNGVPIEGETRPVLYLVEVRETASYHLSATNPAGTTRTDDLLVTVTPVTAGTLDPMFVPAEPPPSWAVTRYRFLAARPDGRILAQMGRMPDTGTIVQLRPDGSSDSAFTPVDTEALSWGLVYGAALQPDGKLVVVTSSAIRRVNADGTLDASFVPPLGTGSYPRAIAVVDSGAIVVAGTTVVGGKEYEVIRLLPSGQLDPEFRHLAKTSIAGAVRRLWRLDDGRLMIGGFFNQVDGEPRPALARLLATGDLDRAYVPLASTSEGSIAVAGDGVVYVSDMGVPLRRLFADGTIDPAFQPMVMERVVRSGRILRLPAGAGIFLQADGGIVLYGRFNEYDGQVVQTPIRVRRDGSIDPSFTVTAVPTIASGAAAAYWKVAGEVNGRLLLDGEFDLVNGEPRPGLAAVLVASAGVADLRNVSLRGPVGTGDAVMIAGFVVIGAEPRPLLVRGVGPTLGGYGVSGALQAPQLELYTGSTLLVRNEGWSGDAAVAAAAGRTGAFALPADSRDAALWRSFNSGGYTAQLSGRDGATGIALAELYVDGEGSTRVVNLSTRGTAGVGDSAMIAGFVLGGSGERQLLVRAIGPTLAPFGVGGALANPRLRVLRDGVVVAENDDWGAGSDAGFVVAAAKLTGAFSLPAGSRDAALLLRLAPGRYTVVIEPATGVMPGVVLAEVYDVTRN